MDLLSELDKKVKTPPQWDFLLRSSWGMIIQFTVAYTEMKNEIITIVMD